MHTLEFIAVYSGEQVWPMGLLFIKASPVKQYSYQNDFSGIFDALNQSFLVFSCIGPPLFGCGDDKTEWKIVWVSDEIEFI